MEVGINYYYILWKALTVVIMDLTIMLYAQASILPSLSSEL